jgi:hypothetical protein
MRLASSWQIDARNGRIPQKASCAVASRTRLMARDIRRKCFVSMQLGVLCR